MTEEELIALRKRMKYACGTQFGEVPHRQRTAAIINQVEQFINDLLKERERANISQ